MDKVKEISQILVDKVYSEVTTNIDGVCAEELGEVVDMIKDMSEIMYYWTVVDAMHKATPQEVINRALPNNQINR